MKYNYHVTFFFLLYNSRWGRLEPNCHSQSQASWLPSCDSSYQGLQDAVMGCGRAVEFPEALLVKNIPHLGLPGAYSHWFGYTFENVYQNENRIYSFG